MNLTFISGNQSKIIETTRLLQIPFESLKLDLTEIQDISINNIVENKVYEVSHPEGEIALHLFFKRDFFLAQSGIRFPESIKKSRS